MQHQDTFTGKIGFVMAAAGSAVGLGNIWRFPYLAAQYGGGVFLITYLILMLTFGYALLIAENYLGRTTGKGPIGAFRELCRGKSSFLGHIRFGGYLNSLAPLLILPYYCVIGGWVTKYVVASFTNPVGAFNSSEYSQQYFGAFISSTWEPLIYFLIFLAITVAVVAFGVRRGVERSSKILMPLLILMIIGICVYCAFLPGAAEGFGYYLLPDWSKFSHMTVVAAIGQLFFSLSIAMGIMITYGSYMCKDDDLVSNVNQVEMFDTGVSFLAGMMIIPAVVAFGGKAAAQSAGPGLVFVTMPQVFAHFNSFELCGVGNGQLFGIAFFVLVLFAAATSAISILETNVQTACQELGIPRKKALLFCTIEAAAIGIITVLGYSVFKNVRPLFFISQCRNYDILDSLDFISNSVVMPIGALFTTILVVAVIGLERFSADIVRNCRWKRQYLFQLCMCVMVIPCLLIVLLSSLGFLS